LERIVELSDLGEGEIRHRVGVSKNNWDNAKKVFPSFAEQLNDVIKNGQSFILADGPGRALDLTVPIPEAREVRTRVPRNARRVTVDTIGRAGTGPETESDEVEIPATIDADALANGIRLRRDRLRRHNLIVQEVAGRLQDAALFDDPFDLLAIFQDIGILVEVKTLDGTASDERDRVRDALSQLLYYEAFVTVPFDGEYGIRKIACFESQISLEHQDWLNKMDIGVIWKTDEGFQGDDLSRGILRDYVEEI